MAVAGQLVFLVGFMGAGKSSVGAALGSRLGWQFTDLDRVIESRSGRSIPQMFRDFGEAGFRAQESAALRELAAHPADAPRVVALGGGAFVQSENVALIESMKACTVFLDAPVEDLYRRCENQGLNRPLLQSLDNFRNLYFARRSGYLAATLRVDTSGKDVETVAAEVAHCLELRRNESQ